MAGPEYAPRFSLFNDIPGGDRDAWEKKHARPKDR